VAEKRKLSTVVKKHSHGLGEGTHSFRTESGSVSANARREAESKGESMPGGRFPIRNASDLANAKHDIGRAKNPGPARAWINKRAKELGEPPVGGSKEKSRASKLYRPKTVGRD